MERSAVEAAGERREVAAAARDGGGRAPSQRRIAARGEGEEEVEGLGFDAW
jgi:hypothetical protein